MKQQKYLIYKLTYLSMLLSIAIILGVVESYITIIKIPGAKLGLSNIVILYLLYKFGIKEAFIISFMRILLVSLIVGSFLQPTFYMGLLGAFMSLLIMFIFKLINKLGIIVTSVFGAIFHVIGEILVGYFIIGKELINYLPIMLILSLVTGTIVGIIVYIFMKYTNDIDYFSKLDKQKNIKKETKDNNNLTK